MNFWQLLSWGLHCRGTYSNFDTNIDILLILSCKFIIWHIWHKFQICHIWQWHMTYMSKVIYANIGLKRFVKISTIQPAAPKLFKVHFDTLNLKKMVQFPLYFLKFPLYFPWALYLMKINTKSNETLGICYLNIW
jgi:hypothetical protein